MPPSKPIEADPDDAEIYSLSVLHQLHCLVRPLPFPPPPPGKKKPHKATHTHPPTKQGVIRDVVQKYEKHDKSRFAGAGHEYHCIDYLRQSIMCAGDTTLDFSDQAYADGARRGFSGANSTHVCRDWESIVSWAVEHREGDKKGIP